MSCVFGLVALTAMLQAPSPVPPAPPDSSAQLIAAAISHIKSQNLDSAAALLQRVAEAAARPVPVRVQAWVLLGVVEFYRSGDSAAAAALREGLALDPNLQAPALETQYPDVAQLLAAERAALADRAPRVVAPTALSDSGLGSRVYDCLAKCPEGVRPPYFVSFPRLEIMESSIGGAASIRGRMRTFLLFAGVIDEKGILEQESLRLSGGTARGTESDLRRGLTQARFAPGRLNNAPVRTRVTLRFDFQAEGVGWVRYSYRVTAR